MNSVDPFSTGRDLLANYSHILATKASAFEKNQCKEAIESFIKTLRPLEREYSSRVNYDLKTHTFTNKGSFISSSEALQDLQMHACTVLVKALLNIDGSILLEENEKDLTDFIHFKTNNFYPSHRPNELNNVHKFFEVKLLSGEVLSIEKKTAKTRKKKIEKILPELKERIAAFDLNLFKENIKKDKEIVQQVKSNIERDTGISDYVRSPKRAGARDRLLASFDQFLKGDANIPTSFPKEFGFDTKNFDPGSSLSPLSEMYGRDLIHAYHEQLELTHELAQIEAILNPKPAVNKQMPLPEEHLHGTQKPITNKESIIVHNIDTPKKIQEPKKESLKSERSLNKSTIASPKKKDSALKRILKDLAKPFIWLKNWFSRALILIKLRFKRTAV